MAPRLPGWLRVIHAFPVATVVVTTTLLLVVLGGSRLGAGGLMRGVLAVLMTQIATGALNDFVDRERDAVTQPEKPIPSGEISPAFALLLTAGSLVMYIPLAASFGRIAFAILTVGLIGGLSYDLWLKPTVLSPLPYIVGFLSLGTWAAIVTDTFRARIVLIYPIAALLLVAAHIAQSLPDIESDLRHGQHGIAAELGPVRSLMALAILTAAASLAGLALAAYTHVWIAAVFAIAGGCISLLAVTTGFRAPYDRSRRLMVFHVAAPAIALIALGSIIAGRPILGL